MSAVAGGRDAVHSLATRRLPVVSADCQEAAFPARTGNKEARVNPHLSGRAHKYREAEQRQDRLADSPREEKRTSGRLELTGNDVRGESRSNQHAPNVQARDASEKNRCARKRLFRAISRSSTPVAQAVEYVMSGEPVMQHSFAAVFAPVGSRFEDR